MQEITLETKISELLNNYDGMKDILVDINPKFKKLNNPVLRRTLAKVAGVRQAAIVGGMDPMDLLNQLRVAVGQEPLNISIDDTYIDESEVPDWALQEPVYVLNANESLDKEQNPLAESYNIMRSLREGEILSVIADFQPEPLIDEFIKSGYEVHLKKISDNEFVTYIKK